MIIIGAVVAAIGLEAFLIPNHLIDGGVVGISLIGSQVFNVPVGAFLIVLNLPFLYLSLKKLGKTFALFSVLGIATLSILTFFIHPSVATDDPILAAIFGGAIVGVGVGLVIRHGGILDGADTVAILIDRKSTFSVGEIIMMMNLFIISSAGFVFGWDKALYSLIAYFVAYKVIDVTVEGLDESKSVWIVSKEYKQIGEAINNEIGRKVTYVNGRNEPGIISDGVILAVITRMEEQKLKSLVRRCDPSAFVVISRAHEIMGKNFQSKP
jgi:uncharacterized membrane-anchored protein YitT (DUF2179 family)